jgi:hypothetical protein
MLGNRSRAVPALDEFRREPDVVDPYPCNPPEISTLEHVAKHRTFARSRRDGHYFLGSRIVTGHRCG